MKEISIQLPKLDFEQEEAVKTLRANLQFCGTEIKVVDVTSCLRNEGKSTISRYLTQSLAESGKNAVLVDADMRKSVTAGELKVHEHSIQGLSHYLSGQCGLMDVVYQTDIAGMYLIFSGTFPPNPAELLSGKRFHAMLQSLRKSFDYVIVDTPPLGEVIDSAIVANECDGSILVISAGSITYPFAQDIVEQLRRANCPILGTVLNKVETRRGGRYYGRFGGYYGSYAREEEKA